MMLGKADVDGKVRANKFHQTCRGNGDGMQAKGTSCNTGSPSGGRSRIKVTCFDAVRNASALIVSVLIAKSSQCVHRRQSGSWKIFTSTLCANCVPDF